MAPTTESALDHWPSADTTTKEPQRPPIYNPEDYAQSLRKFGRRVPAPGSTGPGGASPGLSGPGPGPGPGLPGGGGRHFPDNKSTLQSVASSKSASCAALPLAGSGSGLAGSGPLSLSAASLALGNHRQGGAGGSHRSSSENLRAPQEPEMSLRQFDSVAELLNKLKADLRLAFPSFVQEFVDSAVDGVSLLLELLRTVQLQQGGQGGGGAGPGAGLGGCGGPASQRQALLQENACLQCLHACLRCPDAPRRLAVSPAGLFTLAVSTMSSVNKSRVLALQLLTKTCECAAEGHGAVSEALSTMRLRFGEPVRFRFLAGVLSSAGGQADLLLAGLRFLNAFLRSAPGPQQRVYIQAELGQAGFQPDTLRATLPPATAASAEVQAEFDTWERQQVDVAALTERCQQAESRASLLQDQLSHLQRRLQVLQDEKGIMMSLEHALKERCSELNGETKAAHQQRQQDKEDSRSTPAEDEGISSSDQDRSLSPDGVEREPMVYEVVLKLPETSVDQNQRPASSCSKPQKNNEDDEEETTIEEVMEEFQNIINDAETEVYANQSISIKSEHDYKNVNVNGGGRHHDTLTARIQVPYRPEEENHMRSGNNVPAGGGGRLRLEALFQNAPMSLPPSISAGNTPQQTQRQQLPPPPSKQLPSLDEDEHRQGQGECEIVPSKLLPQPPRRAKSLVHLCAPSKDYANLCHSSPFFDDADSFSNASGDNSDSLLSASREQQREPPTSASAASRLRSKNLRNVEEAAAPRGYRSIAMIMPDETPAHHPLENGVEDHDDDDLIKPVEVSVVDKSQLYQGIPDILRCSSGSSNSKQVDVDPSTVRNGSNYQPASSMLMKPASSLPKKNPPPRKPERSSLDSQQHQSSRDGYSYSSYSDSNNKSASNRTGSFDGLFYVAESPKTSSGGGKGKPPAVAPKKKSLRSSTSASDSQRPPAVTSRQQPPLPAVDHRRSKSKSLERIDEGLNSMVDIVLSKKQQQRLSPEGVYQGREWAMEWGRHANDRLPLPLGSGPSSGPVVIVSRSTSVRHQQRQQLHQAPPRHAGRRTPPEGATHPLFLPVSSRVSAFENGDARSSSSSGPVSASFVIKRGHTNAGLYSGHHVLRDSPSGVNVAKIVNTAPVPPEFGRGIHVNLTVPSGKLTDLPSGLY